MDRGLIIRMAQSTTCYMYSGDEYSSICAMVGYSMILGTTSYGGTNEESYSKYEDLHNQRWTKDNS